MTMPGRLGPRLVTAIVVVAAWAVAIAAATIVLFDWTRAVDVASGGLVAIANLTVIAFVGRAMLRGDGKARVWGLVAVAKLLALLAAGYLLARSGHIDVLAVMVGYGALPLGIATLPFVPVPKPSSPEAGDRSRDLVTAAPIEPASD